MMEGDNLTELAKSHKKTSISADVYFCHSSIAASLMNCLWPILTLVCSHVECHSILKTLSFSHSQQGMESSASYGRFGQIQPWIWRQHLSALLSKLMALKVMRSLQELAHLYAQASSSSVMHCKPENPDVWEHIGRFRRTAMHAHVAMLPK